nr:hypothetical protein [uncultured Methylophaga sp.]
MDKDMRFDWAPKLDIPQFNTEYQRIIDSIEAKKSPRGQSKQQRIESREKELKAVKQIISALFTAFYSLPINTNKVSLPLEKTFYSGSMYSFRAVQKVFDELNETGWIEYHKGSEISGYTRIRAANDLIKIFNEIGFIWCQQKLINREQLVILRDVEPENKKKKIDIPIDNPDRVAPYQDKLYEYNEFINNHCIAMDLDDNQLNQIGSKDDGLELDTDEEYNGISFYNTQLVRIFSRGELTKGGRFYRGWWQSVPSQYRPHITIDGCKTCEIDFSGVAIYIMYARKGIQFEHNRDPYDIGLVGWESGSDPRRKIVKRFFNAKINDETGRFRLSTEEYETLGVNHNALLEMVLNVHYPISEELSSGSGLDTQFIDSEIAQYVMTEMTNRRVVVLPIHDSFIVKLNYERELRDVMLEAFNHFTNVDGQVTVDYPLLPEHFGLSSNELQPSNNDIVGVDDIMDDIFDNDGSLMNRFVGGWESWRAKSLKPI